MTDFLEIRNGRLHVNLHPSQKPVMKTERRWVVVVAGAQSGKTCLGPVWLHREMKRKGPGDYMVISPTFQLLNKKCLPEFRRFFETFMRLGKYNVGDKVFTVSAKGERDLFGKVQDVHTKVFFGYAEDAESLESATAKAAWLDEAGQVKFKLASWQAIRRRLSIHQGRALITTTPYDFGWLMQKFHNPWKAGDPDIEFIRFESRDNPMFPEEEWESAKRDLPGWKFDLFYRGLFTRPAGVIYDNFSTTDDVVPAFVVSPRWPRFLGLDFGGVNTVALFYAQDPGSGRLYLYREYKAGSRTAAQHVENIIRESEPYPSRCAGGSKSEDQWREEFAAAGLGIEAPDFASVEVGIDRVYGCHARGEVKVFDTCEGYLEEKATYRRKLDKLDQPTEVIEDKASFHFMDAERYILSKLATAEDEGVEVVYDFQEEGGFVY